MPVSFFTKKLTFALHYGVTHLKTVSFWGLCNSFPVCWFSIALISLAFINVLL